MRLHPGLGMNPIMVKELRSRMRGARAFVILTATLLLLGTVSYALYRIVLTRMSSHEETRRYVARRRAEGLNTAEIMRCLKRYVARQVFKHLPAAA